MLLPRPNMADSMFVQVVRFPQQLAVCEYALGASSLVYLVDSKLQSLYNLPRKEASGWSSKRMPAFLLAIS